MTLSYVKFSFGPIFRIGSVTQVQVVLEHPKCIVTLSSSGNPAIYKWSLNVLLDCVAPKWSVAKQGV